MQRTRPLARSLSEGAARQIHAHRLRRFRTQQCDLLFRLLGEHLHPAQVAVRDVPPGRCLPLQLFGPVAAVLRGAGKGLELRFPQSKNAE